MCNMRNNTCDHLVTCNEPGSLTLTMVDEQIMKHILYKYNAKWAKPKKK